jgi:plastocyanin
MTRRSAHRGLSLAAALLLAACSSGDSGTNPGPGGQPDTTPASITVVGGDNQSGEAGTALEQQFAVRVANAAGGSLSGVTVSWTVAAGGGSLGGSTSTTNSQGQATNAYILGASAGTNTIRATVQGTSLSTTFTATATEPPPPPDTVATTIEIVSGDSQSAVVGESLDSALVVVVKNAAGQPLASKRTTWTVLAGGGTLLQAETTTNIEGTAANFYEVGSTPGTNTIEVTVAGNPDVKTTFTATATAAPSTAAVTVNDNEFDPDEVKVAVGGTVTWTWAGNANHNVIWTSGGFDDSATQNSGTYAITFGSSGTFEYYCSIHGAPGSGMHGKVEVES